MRNRFLLIIIASLSLFVFSCKNGGDADTFTVTGTINNPGEFKKIELFRLDSTDFTVADTAALDASGKFTLNTTTAYPNLFRIRIGDNSYDIIAKNGDNIEFNATPGKTGFDVKGSQEAAELKAFYDINSLYNGKNTKLVAEFEQKRQVPGANSDSLLNIYRPEFQKNLTAANTELMAFINKNKDKLTAFYAAMMVDPREFEQPLIAYSEAIQDKFTDNPLVQRFVKQMVAAKPVSIGQKAQSFTLPGLDGKNISLSDYKGKYVMLDFWASWCMPCRQENPNVVKAYNKFKDKGFNILGISLDEDKAKWEAAIKADGLTWAQASSLQSFEGAVQRMYQVNAIPSSFIIDPQGNIVAKNLRGPALEEFLNKTFNKP